MPVAQVPMRITIPKPVEELGVARVPMRITIPVTPEGVIVARVPMRITLPEGVPPIPPTPPAPPEEGLKVPWLLIGGGAAVLGAILLMPEKGE